MATAHDIQQSTMVMVMFADGSEPKHMQIYQCFEFPRLTRAWAQFRSGIKMITYFIDNEPISLRGVDDKHQAIADALNEAMLYDKEAKVDINAMIDHMKKIAATKESHK